MKGEHHCEIKSVITTKRQFKCQCVRTMSQGYSTLLSCVSSGISSSRLKEKYNLLALGLVLYVPLRQVEDGSTGLRVRGKDKSVKCWFFCRCLFIAVFFKYISYWGLNWPIFWESLLRVPTENNNEGKTESCNRDSHGRTKRNKMEDKHVNMQLILYVYVKWISDAVSAKKFVGTVS